MIRSIKQLQAALLAAPSAGSHPRRRGTPDRPCVRAGHDRPPPPKHQPLLSTPQHSMVPASRILLPPDVAAAQATKAISNASDNPSPRIPPLQREAHVLGMVTIHHSLGNAPQSLRYEASAASARWPRRATNSMNAPARAHLVYLTHLNQTLEILSASAAWWTLPMHPNMLKHVSSTLAIRTPISM